MKKLIFILISLFLTSITFSNWSNKGVFSFMFSQTGVSDNWGGNEINSLSYIGSVNNEFNFAKDRILWENKLKLQYGRMEYREKDTGEYKFTEAADMINMDTTFTYKIVRFFNPLVSVNIDTQFTEFFEPLTLTENIGMGIDWVRKDDFKLVTKIGFAAKQLFSQGDVDSQAGIQLKTGFKKLFFKILDIESNMEYFNDISTNYDIRWETILSFNIFRSIGIGFNYLWIFRKKTGEIIFRFPNDRQIRQTLAITFNYSLF